jgi:hypothetical protein
MEAPETNIRSMIQELNQYILPSTLMESFDAYREGAYKDAIRSIAPSTLAWFLDMLNRYRGPEDRKESLLEVFDPSMFTVNHPAWETPPGTAIDLPALTSDIAACAANVRNSLKSREARSGSSGSMPIPTTMRSSWNWG